jgi:predicted RNA-binding Zn ribbon-like protein
MSISPTLADLQRHGYPIGGEPSVALDLVDTVANAHTAPTDLLVGDPDAWWALQSGRLPDTVSPDARATERLRASLREAFEGVIDGRAVSGGVVDDLNRVADSAHPSPVLEFVGDTARMTTAWRTTRDGNARLAAIARDAIELLGDPVRRAQLRRCANPTCSMLFLAENSRRVWCASNICGNRARVARHQQRHGSH